MARNSDLIAQRNAAIKADVADRIQVKKMRSEAALQEVGAKYFVTARTVASIYYGEAESQRTKAAEKKAQATGATSLPV
jgi:hypothetical protein